MTRRIRILPDHVANQIAAGEVVERPASVVKELVENALDAGAERIDVELRNGGKTEVCVIDDGQGMEREDALLALDRHATSKIREAEDLSSVRSFGFRGEAIPSIAAVSRFEIDTAAEEGAGQRIRVTAGRVTGVEERARRRGTTVRVRSLFHNVPARARFLKSAAAETRAASEALQLLALANPGVGFRFSSNGRELLHTEACGDLRERVADIWDRELVATLIPVDGRCGDLCVTGLVQRPDAATTRGGRRYLFVNGRPFRDPALVRIADEAYRTTVSERMRPSLFLYFLCPPDAVDVNVHPAKAEVRFRDRAAVESALREALGAALAGLDSMAPLGGAVAERPAEPPKPSVEDAARPVGSGEGIRYAGAPSGPPVELPQLALFVPGGTGEPLGEIGTTEAGPVVAPPELWQLHRRYILAATREGLLIIDQHSAHERVLFEEIMRRFESGGGESQRLLFPITIRLSPAEYDAVGELSSLLRRIGFEIEPFGDRTVILQASPSPHIRFDPERCLREMITELTEGSPLVDSARNQHERIARSMACKGAIKAGEPLGSAEMAELFDRLFATELPGHDVHGRPTIIRLSIPELDRRFGRV